MNHCFRYAFILVFLLFFQAIFTILTIGNPITVYPDPGTVSTGVGTLSSLNIIWIILVFLMDFCINIFIVYGGIHLLHYIGKIKNEDIFIFSKKVFLGSLLIISIVGLSSELIFGTHIVGLLLALFSIFISYILVTKYLLKLSWTNGFLLAIFALFINIIFWLVIFTVWSFNCLIYQIKISTDKLEIFETKAN